ncbi:MAG: sugar phosphate isomerase/epimerase [Verrucomicrobiae bacterium]|nr:sugar phosphate isomerase/epimerase [Verrucomicrobiae bacterium]
MKTNHITRRGFIEKTFLTIAAAYSATNMKAQEYGGNKIPIGVQLYSVRTECEKDLPGTIKSVAKIGYKGVEFAGYYGRDARTLKSILDDNGLKCCGTHIGIDTLLGDNLMKTVEFNKILGNKYLIVPGLPQKYTSSKKAWQETADLFTEISDKLKPHGMLVGYHNHSAEFKPLEGEMPWDTFFSRVSKNVVMQFDTGNAMHGGGEAVSFLKKYPGRAITVHIKPFAKDNPKALIGEDELPWKEIFRLCETTGKTEWYIVEYESDAFPPLVNIQKCLETLKKWGKC